MIYLVRNRSQNRGGNCPQALDRPIDRRNKQAHLIVPKNGDLNSSNPNHTISSPFPSTLHHQATPPLHHHQGIIIIITIFFFQFPLEYY